MSLIKNWPTNLILFFILIFAGFIVSRLFFFQIIKNDFYSALAQGQNNNFLKVQGDRGKIFLKDKNDNLYPAATNRDGKFCFLFSNGTKEKEKTIDSLSKILSLDKEDLLIKFEQNSNFSILKEDLTAEEIENLEDSGIEGIKISDQKIREYPYKQLASDVIGFINEDGDGQYGIEEYYNEELKGEESIFESKKSFGGYLSFFNEDEIKGSDLILTLDYNIQFQAEKLLKRAKENYNIRGGQIIVIDPYSGAVLAMADFPAFNPGSYSSYDFGVFKNNAIQELFEPGSIFKGITMASSLNEGKITPQTTYDDPGMLLIDGWPIYNYDQRNYGDDITMTEVLEKSINTGAVFAEGKLGHDDFLSYLKSFGIFEKTNIDLTGESYSSNEEFKKGYDVNFATASFGQGIEITPIQIVKAFSAIANGGKEINPYIVERMKKDGQIADLSPATEKRKIIFPMTSSKITAMLISVVENGFSKGAQVPGYYIAGKTGTSQISYASLGEDRKGYSNETWQTFIGYAPAFNPRFLVLVKLDNPEAKTASYSAIPIFQDLAEYIIDYLQIPPDY